MRNPSAFILFVILLIASCAQTPDTRWTVIKASRWYDSQPWLSGCNYIPSNAINQIEMWSSGTWSPELIDTELSWAEDLGFNTMRVFLSSLVYANDPDGLKSRIDCFLSICDNHGIRPMFVFFDDCWSPESSYGPQPAPKPGVHNSGWVQDPSKERRSKPDITFPELEEYVKDILHTFGHDDRILMWDLYNEPGNSDYNDSSMELLKRVFEWARESAPLQPLTVGVWSRSFPSLNKFQLEASDIISFHDYGTPGHMTATIDSLSVYGRPMICTEYMARTCGSLFADIMPILKERNVAAINWGFVSGKTNTIFSWDNPMPDTKEPPVWFHDIFRPDHTPFDEKEIQIIKDCNGADK